LGRPASPSRRKNYVAFRDAPAHQVIRAVLRGWGDSNAASLPDTIGARASKAHAKRIAWMNAEKITSFAEACEMSSGGETPFRQIRAVYDDEVIRVYQAYSNAIANAALQKGTFVSPPFKLDRMTWIKPSFLWMMYRCGWGYKDPNQERVLAIDISRPGFEWALEHSCLSHHSSKHAEGSDWEEHKRSSPVRVQWDPERDIQLRPLAYRSIQIGLGKEAVSLYVNEWIKKIFDVTDLAHSLCELVKRGDLAQAESLLPSERPYPVSHVLEMKLGMLDKP
jgi:hypothetical protein